MNSNALQEMNPLNIVNQAYDKDFRWWFLALLVCVMLLGLWALRYLLNRSEQEGKAYTANTAAMQLGHEAHVKLLVSELTSSREHHHAKMEAMQNQAFGIVREVAALVASNNKVIESNTRESENVRRVIENMERART